MRAQLIGLLLLLMAGAAQSEKITAVADPWPPFVDPELPSQGISLEIVRAAYATQGYEIDMDFVPWARALAGVKQGVYDIIPNAWRTREREASFYFSKPYVTSNIRFIKRKGDPFEYTGPRALDGKVIGITRGYAYNDVFATAENFERSEASDLEQNVRKLLLNRIGLTLDDELVARAVLSRQAPQLLSQIEFVDQPLALAELHVISGRANPRHQELIDAFNRGLAKITVDGTLGAILQDLE